MSSLIRTPFGPESTAAEVVAGVDLSGKRAVVTGASSGIGIETARALAGAGAQVTLAVRDTARGAEVAADISTTTGNDHVEVAPIELADPSSVDAFVQAWSGPLHILVNNAGIMAIPERTLTDYGQELHFATNHLGHFRLAVGLHDALAAAAGARIVSVSSAGNLVSPVNFDDLNYSFIPYDGIGAYGQSKTANVLFAVGVGQRWADDGIAANALMPGAVSTGLMRHMDPAWFADQEGNMPMKVKTPAQGAATSTLLAASPLVDGVTGRYFEDVNEAKTVTERGDGGSGVAPYALDPANAERLWDISLNLIRS
ncbi:SDR family NAD(P)-dependent oxidoreductase [Mycolicibacterium fortuitum]|uniref:SDR family NAD(P)-dependent oxidoreductase n=1 Tax=Mycolicibacterium fortuitum TaxID=1766 RepID=UPI001AEFB578|nr:SDR family NAD(P)-dependent oxidoreductase [Mycolicibacterium fortuitum]MBP3083809.1 SDR family NAD(P)-dependent oxidoreductase [Mycolicibacterium fortuitum]